MTNLVLAAAIILSILPGAAPAEMEAGRRKHHHHKHHKHYRRHHSRRHNASVGKHNLTENADMNTTFGKPSSLSKAGMAKNTSNAVQASIVKMSGTGMPFGRRFGSK